MLQKKEDRTKRIRKPTIKLKKKGGYLFIYLYVINKWKYRRRGVSTDNNNGLVGGVQTLEFQSATEFKNVIDYPLFLGY